jgi:hypothetical protein
MLGWLVSDIDLLTSSPSRQGGLHVMDKLKRVEGKKSKALAAGADRQQGWDINPLSSIYLLYAYSSDETNIAEEPDLYA